MKTKIYLFLIFLIPLFSQAQLNVYSANELDSLQYFEERPVLFFIKTDWCSICLGMENKVLQSDSVSEILNKDYYLVILNAESKEDVVYKGKRFVYEPTGLNEGKHQLAMQLARKNGEVSFPSTVLMIGNDVVYKNNSFMNQEDLLEVLKLVSHPR
ncbi:thioredoxin fold domain-containing protein [Brumimicrobium oceani]|nr:thioredoxin fold domain-containing protein [Brumimicrobium oceani]